MVDNAEDRPFSTDYDPLMINPVIDVSLQEFVYDKRRPYIQAEFNNVYNYSNNHHKNGLSKWFKNQLPKCGPISLLVSFFPIFRWLPEYEWKKDFYHDVVSGITVAVMHIPQGLAYSTLGAVPPIVGIYMAFFPVLIYIFMGTSRHVSMGTFAVICMMTSKPVLEYSTSLDPIDVNNSTHLLPNNLTDNQLTPIQVATAVCFIVGLWQVLFGLLHLGSLSVLMSEFLVSGFTTGAAVMVLTSQMKHIFGLKLPPHTGYLKTIFTYIDLAANIKSSNFLATGMTFIVVVILTVYSDILKPYLSKKLPVPLPVELIIITGGTLASIFWKLPSEYNITAVGNIPTGFPPPKLPPLWILPNLVIDGLVIALVAFSINISMASIFAKTSKYEIDANQELIASGCGNLFGSFFSCIPFAASLSRSLIQYTVGGRTQLASAVSCSLLVLVLLYIGPFFEPLPNCILTGIIIVALRGMLMQVKEFWRAWKQSKRDGFIWMITFLSVVILDIDKALIIGLVISVLCIVLVGQKPTVITLGHIPSTSIYLDLKCYTGAVAIPHILILQIAGAMHFANKEAIRQKIFKRVSEKVKTAENTENSEHELRSLILDLTTVFYIDPSSVKSVITMYNDLKSRNIKLCLVGCSGKVHQVLKKCDFFKAFPESQLYPTIHDAILLSKASNTNK
ncbi:sulfate transporter-like isoform X2 [Lycorma delicatula]|uniref:sulfate transporter-like isoform X2 n=1 Tax=Lycorma delicatula TaxID=130591 RepID=UPI003F515C53